MKVKDVMTSNVKSCRPEASLAAGATMMWEYDIGVLPVVNEAGKVLGMITDRDIAIAAATKGRPATEIPVQELISGRLYPCHQNDDVHTALKTMRQERVHRLPVVNEDGMLQGILSMNDIVNRAEESRGKREPKLSYEDAMSTLKAICEHRPLKAAAHA
jgi:CBS domain-containing protein